MEDAVEFQHRDVQVAASLRASVVFPEPAVPTTEILRTTVQYAGTIGLRSCCDVVINGHKLPQRGSAAGACAMVTEPQVERDIPVAFFLAIVAAIGGFLFGFDTAVINGAVDAIEATFGTSSFVTGFVVAVALLGSAVGAWFAGAVADRYGRIRVMLLAALLFRRLGHRLGVGVLSVGPGDLALR